MKLTDQHACVQREIKQRERVYPRLVAKGSMSQQKADYELAAMREVLKTIEGVMMRRDVPRHLSPDAAIRRCFEMLDENPALAELDPEDFINRVVSEVIHDS